MQPVKCIVRYRIIQYDTLYCRTPNHKVLQLWVLLVFCTFWLLGRVVASYIFIYTASFHHLSFSQETRVLTHFFSSCPLLCLCSCVPCVWWCFRHKWPNQPDNSAPVHSYIRIHTAILSSHVSSLSVPLFPWSLLSFMPELPSSWWLWHSLKNRNRNIK